jgi:competence protein ComEA
MAHITTLLVSLGLLVVQLPEGEGKALTEKVCNNCHGPENYIAKRLNKDGWEEVIQQMVSQGAQASDAEFDTIVEYLARNFGPKVNVNKAPAKEIETSLELTSEEAGAIVTYREKNGAFKTIDDLKRVPGVDAKKIEARKDRVDF